MNDRLPIRNLVGSRSSLDFSIPSPSLFPVGPAFLPLHMASDLSVCGHCNFSFAI